MDSGQNAQCHRHVLSSCAYGHGEGRDEKLGGCGYG